MSNITQPIRTHYRVQILNAHCIRQRHLVAKQALISFPACVVDSTSLIMVTEVALSHVSEPRPAGCISVIISDHSTDCFRVSLQVCAGLLLCFTVMD